MSVRALDLWICFVLSVQMENFALNTQPETTADRSGVTDFPTCFAADARPAVWMQLHNEFEETSVPQPSDSLGPALEFTFLMMHLSLPPQSCFHTTNVVGRMLRFVITVTEQNEMMWFYEGVETIYVCVYFYRTVLGSGLFFSFEHLHYFHWCHSSSDSFPEIKIWTSKGLFFT